MNAGKPESQKKEQAKRKISQKETCDMIRRTDTSLLQNRQMPEKKIIIERSGQSPASDSDSPIELLEKNSAQSAPDSENDGQDKNPPPFLERPCHYFVLSIIKSESASKLWRTGSVFKKAR